MTAAIDPPSWILFDADGVLQRTRVGAIDELTAAGGERGQEFTLAVFAAELACVTGADFGAAMEGVLRDFGIRKPLHEVIPPDYWIEVDETMLAAVRTLRDRGLRCGLATTQSNLRGEFMRCTPGFADSFDAEFYSYRMGVAKPDGAYFAAVLDRVRVPADRVLFLDDSAANVAGAAEAGLRAELFPRDGGVQALRPILRQHGVRL